MAQIFQRWSLVSRSSAQACRGREAAVASSPACGRPPVVSKAMANDETGPSLDVGGHPAHKRVVICGGGIIGASIAYYLSQKGVGSTVVEREEVACAASGKAGGFLALDWNDSSPVGKLARLSYRLHAELAERFGAEAIGYRPVQTLQVAASEAAAGASPMAKIPGADLIPSWLDGNVLMAADLGGPSTTAQVHPKLLTQALMDSALSRGGALVKGQVEGLQLAADGQSLQGVVVDGQVLPADAAVIAMGPWSSQASAWLNGALELDITGQKYHSILLRPQEGTSNHCLFTNFRYASGRSVEPEVYPRPDGSVYVCGEPQAMAVPPSAADVTVEPQLCANLAAVASSLSAALRTAPVEVQQACYLPISPDGLPVIGKVPGLSGVYVATGHSCWGILNGPATGKAISELVVDGVVKCLPGGLSAFSPGRLF